MTRHHLPAIATIVFGVTCLVVAPVAAQQTTPPAAPQTTPPAGTQQTTPPAGTQQAAPPATGKEPGRARSWELAVGGELLTSQNLGSANATMTTPAGGAYNYFSVDATRAVAPAFRGRVGYNVTPVFTIEGGLVIANSDVRATISGDAESATISDLPESLTQYFVDVSGLVHLRQFAFLSGAGVPFLEAGGGYMRQLHEGGFAPETGQIYHFGGGATYMFSGHAFRSISGLGVRVDARVYVPRKGYHLGQTQSLFAAIGGSLVVAF